jgi:TRAP-type mannitol/chloroaromatic compound transport system permease small subunit
MNYFPKEIEDIIIAYKEEIEKQEKIEFELFISLKKEQLKFIIEIIIHILFPIWLPFVIVLSWIDFYNN